MSHETSAQAVVNPVPGRRDPSGLTILGLGLLIGALASIASPAFAQASPMPDNAHARSYGEGWECDRTFRRDGADCIPVVVPANAYPTKRIYGDGWACHHGYRETAAGACAQVVVPDGGYLDPSGANWSCLRGFEKRNAACVVLDLPENAYLSDSTYGRIWTCERGYAVVDDACEAIVVPENGYLNASGYGQPWSCERGYVDRGASCDGVIIPENAYFDETSYGPGWTCERGYKAVNDACIAVVLPANAHLDRTGNRWACNKNFQRSRGQCVLNE